MDNLQSEQIDKISEALAKAQGEMRHALFDGKAKVESSKGSYTYGYATYQSLVDAAKEPLSRNGLAVIHQIGLLDGQRIMITKVVHSSGQWFSSILHIPLQEKKTYEGAFKETPQTLGSAITYFKRYSLGAILALGSEEDDDAQTAEGIRGDDTIKHKRDEEGSSKANYSASKSQTITKEQADTLRDSCDGDYELLNRINKMFNIDKIENLPSTQFQTQLKFIMENRKQKENGRYAKTGS